MIQKTVHRIKQGFSEMMLETGLYTEAVNFSSVKARWLMSPLWSFQAKNVKIDIKTISAQFEYSRFSTSNTRKNKGIFS